MNSCGKRLGVAMLSVVLVLGLNAFAVLSGAADGAYARLFGHQSDRYLAAQHTQTAAPRDMLSAAECGQSHPKPLRPRSLVPVTATVIDAPPVVGMC